jgi:hypothetical protein
MIEKNIEFKIDRIDIINSSIIVPTQQSEVNGFNFELQIQMKLDNINKVIMVFVDITVNTQESKEVIGRFIACCTFSISNYDDVVVKSKTKNFELPKIAIDILNSISISTVRGLMFGSFRGTFLHNAILPVVDPTLITSQQIQ